MEWGNGSPEGGSVKGVRRGPVLCVSMEIPKGNTKKYYWANNEPAGKVMSMVDLAPILAYSGLCQDSNHSTVSSTG